MENDDIMCSQSNGYYHDSDYCNRRARIIKKTSLIDTGRLH